MPVTIYWRKYKSGNRSAFLLVNEDGKQQKIPINIHIKKGDSVKEKKLLAEKIRYRHQVNNENKKHGFQPQYKKEVDFIKYFRAFLKEYPRKDVQKVRNSLAKFILFIKKEKFSISNLSPSLCEKFMLFLQYDCGLSGDTPYSYWKKFKQVIKQAKREKVLKENPCEDIKFKNHSKGNNKLKKNILVMEELQTLYKTPCNADTKKTFLFGCYTGLGYAEIKKIKWERVVNEKLILYRSKNEEQVIIDLHPSARLLIGPNGAAKDKIFPNLISNSMIARHLKKWVARSGITKNISFYCCRHTFAVMLLSNGADLLTVSRCLGHSDTKHTQKYLNYVDNLKAKAIASLPGLDAV
jgi:site-specific recombinase XerD